MIEEIGYFSLVLTFLVAIYGAVAAAYGAGQKQAHWIESARHAMVLTWPLLSLASGSLILLLLLDRYDISFVYSVSNRSMPMIMKIAALWGGQAGSLVFWSWIMAGFAAAAGLRKWAQDRELLPWVIVVTMGTLAFFVFLVAFIENPFSRFWLLEDGQQTTAFFKPQGARSIFPGDGRGLNPLLHHPGMILHPPMLYLGFVGFVVPYAFAIAALISGRTDARWIRITRRWTLIAWLFLSLGLILGMRWAYDVLGWGGYWGWDPVEIAALLPWLTGTAFLHSVIIQEKRGMLKQWNMVLIILTYNLVIFGTFLTRSGVLSSVHAFAQSAIGPLFFIFIGVTLIVSVRILLQRWPQLKGEEHLASMFSREALFLLQNLIFVGILVVCFWGVLFPLISELFTGQKVTVGPPFYERATGPLWAVLLLLMGIAPLSAYGSSSWRNLGRALWKPALGAALLAALLLLLGMRNLSAIAGYGLAGLVVFVILFELWRAALARHRRHGENLPIALMRLSSRNRRRYGGYLIHLGVVLMAIGILGIELFQTETQGTIARGGQITLGRYTMIYESLTRWDTSDGRNVARAVIEVYRDGKALGQIYPRRDYFYAQQQSMTIPGLRSTLEDDLYVVLIGWEPIAEQGATFKVFHNPLVNFIWLGGLVFILGTLVAIWPDREPVPLQRRVSVSGAKARIG